MKNLIIAACVLSTLAACKGGETDPMILPQIAFKTTAGYVSRDTTVAKGTVLLTGIAASKSEPNDVLKRFIITRNYDLDSAATIYTEDLSGAAGDTYSHDYSITSRSIAGTEKYSYTVVNRDGLVNTVKLTVTTQ